MNSVFVLSNTKKPLMPCRPARARKLLSAGWAAMCGDGDPQFPRITRTISSDRGCAWCGYHPSIPAFEAAQA